MPPIPFLAPEDQEGFLRAHHMIDDIALSPEDKDWLHSVNFHYVMGYARNYRALVGRGHIDEPRQFSSIRSVIEAESELSAFLAPWLRKAEWHLRSLTVKHFCEVQGHGEGFLDNSGWNSFKAGDCEKLQSNMVDSILRHGEPYVAEHIDRRAFSIGIDRPRMYDSYLHEKCLDLVEGLPLWSVVDSFSIGVLGKFILRCGQQPDGEELVWKKISQDLGITAKHFEKTMEVLGITRNLVFHHQRLWMRPMVKSPGIPNDLSRRYRDYGFKNKNKEAQFIALAVISKFLPNAQRETYLTSLEEVVQRNQLFSLGIMRPPVAQQQTR